MYFIKFLQKYEKIVEFKIALPITVVKSKRNLLICVQKTQDKYQKILKFSNIYLALKLINLKKN